MRVEGNISFTGVLRVEGDVVGDVSCDADSNGTIVVHRSANVTGTIKTPHIVVSGRVYGPVHASESIEIHQGACVVGDAFYKEIDIHAGGVIEGWLTPRALTDRDRLKQEHRIQVLERPAVKECDMPPLANGSRSVERFGSWRKLGAAVALIIAVVTVVWVNRDPTANTPPAAAVALEADSSAKGASAAPSAPVGSDGSQGGPRAVTGDTGPLVPDSNADTKGVAQTFPSDRPEMDLKKVVTVQGMNPDKPAGVFFVIAKEPAALSKKRRKDPADGTRIDLAQGASVRIAIARNEIFRVAKGRDIEIFYQGRKVAPKTIESGAWMSFVPLSSSRESDK